MNPKTKPIKLVRFYFYGWVQINWTKPIKNGDWLHSTICHIHAIM